MLSILLILSIVSSSTLIFLFFKLLYISNLVRLFKFLEYFNLKILVGNKFLIFFLFSFNSRLCLLYSLLIKFI